MTSPYQGLPDTRFWRRSVAMRGPTEIDPIVGTEVRIGPRTRVATAGSCFAQHIARTLSGSGFHHMVAEAAPAFHFSGDENYGTFSARYGNVYTVRQLWQLFRRAYAVFEPAEGAWRRKDGRFVDPFRPRISSAGFETVAQLEADREVHLAAVRTVFEECDVFVFTLGLTEAWVSVRDGAVVPFAPGVVAAPAEPDAYRFHNSSVAEMEGDLLAFLRALKAVNPGLRVVLTVSPVPLIATFEPRHVLTATTYSKAALRVVADQAAATLDFVDYFPAYEMIAGPQARGAFYEDDLREIRPEGVAHVMAMFARHYLTMEAVAEPIEPVAIPSERLRQQAEAIARLSTVICDEDDVEAAP